MTDHIDQNSSVDSNVNQQNDYNSVTLPRTPSTCVDNNEIEEKYESLNCIRRQNSDAINATRNLTDSSPSSRAVGSNRRSPPIQLYEFKPSNETRNVTIVNNALNEKESANQLKATGDVCDRSDHIEFFSDDPIDIKLYECDRRSLKVDYFYISPLTIEPHLKRAEALLRRVCRELCSVLGFLVSVLVITITELLRMLLHKLCWPILKLGGFSLQLCRVCCVEGVMVSCSESCHRACLPCVEVCAVCTIRACVPVASALKLVSIATGGSDAPTVSVIDRDSKDKSLD